ncbi:hypothetical protein CLIB1423_13S01574 [[Candida] railenensis]|uniref:Gamma-glutamyltransferase n=1 Tax=[Candida] railenensis TaxID=45579 RepID=A0A9P0VYM0_9ASCO|nr:hypothetical protein CLIB1423_13S01574 [[Candida] railenensis]
MPFQFDSRRSAVYSTKGIVASSQPAATSAGVKILELGGNCVEAAVAVSACLCVLEPPSTGIGGDCFALFYEKKSKTVHGMNGSGRSGQNVGIDDVLKELNDPDALRIPWSSIYSVTVPGAIAGWIDSIEKWGSGKVTLEQIFAPAIDLARNGFVVHEISANIWLSCTTKLKNQNLNLDFAKGENAFLNQNGEPPKEGDLFYNLKFAEALEKVVKYGKKGFYEGEVAEAIIKTTSARGHKLTLDDLKNHKTTFLEPISIAFEKTRVWEIAPNGQGLVALIALGMLQELHNEKKIDLYNLKHNSVEYLHVLIELCKLGFYDSDEYVSDPDFNKAPLEELLHKDYLSERSKLFKADKILDGNVITYGVPNPLNKSDTVYFTVSDSNGDACSFINSVYEGFGSAIIVPEFGFCLQNRGANFNLVKGSKNSLEGGKRPYHTIIPSMITNLADDSLFASFGNMGGYMQPVGHVQHVLNLSVFGMNPQQSIDQPRFCLIPDPKGKDHGRGADGPVSTPVTIVALEEGIDVEVVKGLEKLGHTVSLVKGYKRGLFGRSQIIRDNSIDGKLIYSAGSDPRGDGIAIPLI